MTRTLQCWYSFAIRVMRTPRVFTHTEGNTRAPAWARVCRSAGVHRPWHAGREASEHSGSPKGLLTWGQQKPGTQRVRHTWGNPETARGWHLPVGGRTTHQVGGKPLEALGVSSQAEDSAVGKAHSRGKDLTAVRRLHRQRVPDMSGWRTTSQPHCRAEPIEHQSAKTLVCSTGIHA